MRPPRKRSIWRLARSNSCVTDRRPRSFGGARDASPGAGVGAAESVVGFVVEGAGPAAVRASSRSAAQARSTAKLLRSASEQ